ANGALDFLRGWLGVHFDLAALHVVLEFKVLEHIPLGDNGSVALPELAAAVGIDAGKLGRLMRLLACQRFLQEPEDDRFAHTPASAALAADPELVAQFLMQ